MALKKWTYSKPESAVWAYPNKWDFFAICLVLAVLFLLAWGSSQMAAPYHLGESIPISLSPSELPYYALRSVLRMFIALFCSLIFTLVVGTLAAKNRHAERLIIPLIDILQSVPVLGYLSITVVIFIALFPNSMFGPECAAILAIFTAQVWNMTLSFYQSMRTVPHDLKEASRMFHLSAWQRFWRLEVPFAMPGLLWNMMMSMSASWFFVVASEAISVSNQNITLPGIGSYIALAVRQANIQCVVYAIIAMFFVILLYDQLLFRPLNEWASKFRFEQFTEEKESNSWVINLFQRTRWLRHWGNFLQSSWDYFVNLPLLRTHDNFSHPIEKPVWFGKSLQIFWYVLLTAVFLFAFATLLKFVLQNVTFTEMLHVVYLGLITAIRVMVLIMLSSLIWVPLGVWIGRRSRIAEFSQPIIQFLASFPVNLFYPVAVMLIVKYQLNVNIWTSPLMILGAQWYIAFNVIAGTTALPKDLSQAAKSLNVKGWLWWRRLVLPGIFPYYVTGAITAAGGAWNASIIAEAVSWGQTKLVATGLGSYITQASVAGDFPRLALGISVMCIYVLVINRIVWRPLYRFVQERYQLA